MVILGMIGPDRFRVAGGGEACRKGGTGQNRGAYDNRLMAVRQTEGCPDSMPDFSRRTLTPEKMDEDSVPRDDLARSLRFIRWVNRRLGGAKAVIGHLDQWCKSANRSMDRSTDRSPRPSKQAKPIRILDVATGCADIPVAIVQWAKQAGVAVQITAVDRHATTLALAVEHVNQSLSADDVQHIELVEADALNLPFAANSYDYCITSMFLHHLRDIELWTVLAAMERIAERGMIVNDLLRNRRAYNWCKLLTTFSGDIVKHDARVSVLAGFTKREVVDIRDRLDLRYMKYHKHAFHRFTLAGER